MYVVSNDELYHHGVLGMKWGVRRYQSYAENPKLSDRKKKKLSRKVESLSAKKTSKLDKIEKDRKARIENAKRINEYNFDKDRLTEEKASLQRANKGRIVSQVINAAFEKDDTQRKMNDLDLSLKISEAEHRIRDIDDIFKDYDNVKAQDLKDRRSAINSKAKTSKEKVASRIDKKISKLQAKLGIEKGPDGSKPASEKTESRKIPEHLQKTEDALFSYFDNTKKPLIINVDGDRFEVTKESMQKYRQADPEEYEEFLEAIVKSLS